ncbi:hypothetical protein A0O21_09455 [Streptococcus pantholopis]|uniref:Uncharacterized protein n=1 Tax=Streptococcus pantholopis TaxID=1811193 RepID=A0A172Q9Y0_9STRE|nr:hypothetical protein A0O21_09455 [Streptococcus pantholopis]
MLSSRLWTVQQDASHLVTLYFISFQTTCWTATEPQIIGFFHSPSSVSGQFFVNEYFCVFIHFLLKNKERIVFI